MFSTAREQLPVDKRTAKPIYEALKRMGVQGVTHQIVSTYVCNSKPETRKRKAAHNAREDVKKRKAAHNAREDVKKRMAAHNAREDVKKRKAAYEAREDVKKMRKEENAKYRAREGVKKQKAAYDAREDVKKMKKVKREAAAAASREDFLANNPQLDGAVWTKEKAVAFALKAYQETRFKELGGRTAQEAATSNKFVMSVGKHGTIDPKALRTEAFASLSRNTTSTWIDSDGKEQTRRSVYAFKYPKGKEKRWGPKAAEAGMETRPFLTMTEAEAIGFKHITLAVFPNSLNALEGEYAVQVKAKDDLMDSEFSGVSGGTPTCRRCSSAPLFPSTSSTK